MDLGIYIYIRAVLANRDALKETKLWVHSRDLGCSIPVDLMCAHVYRTNEDRAPYVSFRIDDNELRHKHTPTCSSIGITRILP